VEARDAVGALGSTVSVVNAARPHFHTTSPLALAPGSINGLPVQFVVDLVAAEGHRNAAVLNSYA